MNGVINFEYLISAALYEPKYFNKAVHGMRLLSEIYSDDLDFLFVENNIIIKMQDNGYYPSKSIFQRVVAKLDDEPVFGADDIVRMVNVFLSKAIQFDEKNVDQLIEWEKEAIPKGDICSLSDDRGKQVIEQLLGHAISNQFSNEKTSILYYESTNPLGKCNIIFEGKIKDAFPPLQEDDKDFSSAVEIFSSIEDYLLQLDGFELYKESTTIADYKLSLFVGAKKLIKVNNLDTSIEWDDFKIGDCFIESLIENEANADRRYSSATYEAVINFLAKTGKSEVNLFYRSDDSDQLRRVEHFTAYRTHITKAGRALRLLTWKNEKNNSWIISNIGNKDELYISNP
ncbi:MULTISPECIES: hypothetical protein [Pantoea]|uniref:hypothetical protein n=1 Tax=Pantoea TaxID=53335 RepID=UPI002596A051|nr:MULTISPECIES: hypothetical protein [Pantoea]